MQKRYETITTITGLNAKVYGPNEFAEYVVKFYHHGAKLDEDYHTDDLDDAIGTARAEISRECLRMLREKISA